MARITVEDCLKNVANMYDLVLLATTRTRQLYRGSEPEVQSKNRVIVTALREIAAGRVTPQNVDDVKGGSAEDEMAPFAN